MIRQTLSICALAAVGLLAEQAETANAALQQRLSEIKQSIAKNQARLRQYAWTETTEISLKGEAKKRTQAACQYGADGKVQKTAIGAAPPPQSRRGIKGRIAANKIDEMKDYMDRAGSLVRRYVPPDPLAMQAAFKAGKAALNTATGDLVFSDYVKPGDKVTVTFDPAAQRIRSFAVATYLDEPKDSVTLNARFSSLPDGTNFLEEVVLNASAKEIQIRTTNFGYRKAAS